MIDSSHVRALKGGPKTGPSPVDRAKTGSKHHVIADGNGIPLAVSLTGGNRNDVTPCRTGFAAYASAGKSATTSTRPS